MSVDTKVVLPPQVQLDDVAKAIALLLGKPKKWTDCAVHSPHGNYPQYDEPTAHGWVTVNGIKFKQAEGQPTCVTIDIGEIPVMYGDGWWFFYHFELHSGANRGMIGGSRAERIALHRRLVDIFGGYVDYRDNDEVKKDYERHGVAPAWLGMEGDEYFHQKQLALWKITPITQEEIAECEQFAAYQKG